jgi:RES domain
VSRKHPWEKRKRHQPSKVYTLDEGDLQDISNYKRHTAELLRFHWNYYAELAYQRAEIKRDLQRALQEKATKEFIFSQWQRAIKYKYCLDPLNTIGSLNDPGGRFNVGRIDPIKFPIFPALYLASDKETAIQELLGQEKNSQESGLSRLELALIKKDSISIVAMDGQIDQVFDLRYKENLEPFVELIKDFTLSKELIKEGKKLGIPNLRVIKSVDLLLKTFLSPNWREYPMLFDIPANSQIFGQLTMSAGIQGIVYPSKITGSACLSVFPQTLADTSSHVQLSGEIPAAVETRRRMDSLSYDQFY